MPVALPETTETTLFTIEETAKMLNVSVRYLYDLRAKDRIKSYDVAGRILFAGSDIQRLQTERKKAGR